MDCDILIFEKNYINALKKALDGDNKEFVELLQKKHQNVSEKSEIEISISSQTSQSSKMSEMILKKCGTEEYLIDFLKQTDFFEDILINKKDDFNVFEIEKEILWEFQKILFYYLYVNSENHYLSDIIDPVFEKAFKNQTDINNYIFDLYRKDIKHKEDYFINLVKIQKNLTKKFLEIVEHDFKKRDIPLFDSDQINLFYDEIYEKYRDRI